MDHLSKVLEWFQLRHNCNSCLNIFPCREEVGIIMQTNYYRAMNMALFFTAGKIIVFLALLAFVLMGNSLTAEAVFVTTGLINNVRLVMTLFFPFAISFGSEAKISCKRLQVRSRVCLSIE